MIEESSRPRASSLGPTLTIMIEVDLWLRGNNHATTATLRTVQADATQWTDADVEHLLTEMLLALDREKNPGGEPPPVSLRGFNWIVSPDESRGVLLHLEMQMGTASAGPFALGEAVLSAMITRVLTAAQATTRVH
jgi:hypothetical protein